MVAAERFQYTEEGENRHLTSREVEVLQFVAQGLRNSEIAAQLIIQPETVKYHITITLNKLNVGTRMQAVLKGVELGAVSLEEATAEFDSHALSTLTLRELELLDIMTRDQGLYSSYEGAAEQANITFWTVKDHMSNILRKTKAKNKIQAGLLYLRSKQRETTTLKLLETTIEKWKKRYLAARVEEVQNLGYGEMQVYSLEKATAREVLQDLGQQSFLDEVDADIDKRVTNTKGGTEDVVTDTQQ